MSTIYNRRRGGSARRTKSSSGQRKPRQCAHVEAPRKSAARYSFDDSIADVGPRRCSRLAPVNRYCGDHQRACR